MKYVLLVLCCCVGIALVTTGAWLAGGWMAIKSGLIVVTVAGGCALLVFAGVELQELIKKRRKDGQRDGG